MKRADMSQRRAALTRLYEELRSIQMLDRVHEYATDTDVASERARVIRQMRRKQVVDEIARVRAAGPEAAGLATVTSVLAIVCAVGYAMLHYLFK
jgi:hypothetical protein